MEKTRVMNHLDNPNCHYAILSAAVKLFVTR